jgi:hypothetical protein
MLSVENTIGSELQPFTPIAVPVSKLAYYEARIPVINNNGRIGRLEQTVSDAIVDNLGMSSAQAQVLERSIFTMVNRQYDASPGFWYEIGVRSPHIWEIEQTARRILGTNVGIFMKNTPSNYQLLQKKIFELGPRFKYMLHYYSVYHAYVTEPIYALTTYSQVPAWVPVENENENGILKKVMLYCVTNLYPRIFYEDHKRHILWRKGGLLIEQMSYQEEHGIWVRTQEGIANATKIEIAWYEIYP